MKRRTNYLTRAATVLLLAVLGVVGAWAQSSVVSIGSTNRSDGNLPLDQYSKYSLSQQIYTSEEINHVAGKITSIAFYGYDYGMERTCDIYLTPTTKNSFDGNTDWVTVAAGDKVFSGQITVNNGVWTVIDFDTPYEYDGSSNIILTVDDNSNVKNSSTVYWGVFDASGNQALYYSKRYSTPVNLDPTQPIEESGAYYARKNCIRLCFETYIKPYKLEAVEVGDVSAQIQCSLRGDATAWNLRYRKVGDGDWIAVSNLTERSKTIEELTAHTKYEVQVQSIFPEDHLSDWTESLEFTTNCCPVEEQAELIYALKSNNYVGWFGFAVQIKDITDEENPVEVAYLYAPSHQLYGGSVTLCCGHKYQVNWIYDEDYKVYNGGKSFALYLEPGDLLYSMDYGEAPNETSELTTFVMDCTPYCAQMPQTLSVTGTTYESATLTFVSQTKKGQVVYSTEADFDPETVTPEDMDFEELPQSDDPWGGTPPNASVTLKGLQPLTAYYVRVRSVCTAEPIGTSRWSEPIKVITGSRYDGPTQVIAEPINSSKEQLSWGGQGNETGYNLFYRAQTPGNPVDASAIQTFGGGKGTGFKNGSGGEGIWRSSGDRPFSNTLFVTNVPAGSSFGFKAGNDKTGAGLVKFLYGLRKFVGPLTEEETMRQFDQQCLNDADRQARIDDLNAQLAALALKMANEEITQEEYDQQKADIEATISSLNSLPSDAQKLEQMRTLEQKMEDNNAELAALALKNANGEITDKEFAEQSAALEAQNALLGSDLSELRAITTNAENTNKDGFSISKEQESANAPRRAGENDTYIFFIRHNDPNGVLSVKDLTITPPEQLGAWTVVNNIKGTEYTLTGLTPGTTYEVMVEPVYENGTTGTQSHITVFTTLDEAVEPVLAEFSVSEGKKVNFAHGNLRCEGVRYEDTWSMAKQQYEVLGQDNIEDQGTSSYPAWLVDLFCWSTEKNYYGVSTYHYYNDEEAEPYFNGDFAEWGECPSVIRDLGPGWSTLNKSEWNYLLNERENAASRKAHATVNEVKGLVILPDAWTAPAGVAVTAGGIYTAEQWATLEEAGAVFLPAAGQMTTAYENYNATTTVTEAGSYWTSTESDDASGMKACTMTFTDAGITLDADLNRRVMTAVRLVKVTQQTVTTAASGFTTLVSNASLDFSNVEGLTAYIATSVDNTEGTVTLKRIGVVPANTPVVLKGAPSTTYPIAAILTTAAAPLGNLLRGSATKSTELEANTAYILSGGKFHRNNAGTMPAGKAYLPAAAVDITSSAPQLTIVFDDGQTTAIKEVGSKKEDVRGNSWYDLSGRKLSGMPSQKGLYIINGKKIVIK